MSAFKDTQHTLRLGQYYIIIKLVKDARGCYVLSDGAGTAVAGGGGREGSCSAAEGGN